MSDAPQAPPQAPTEAVPTADREPAPATPAPEATPAATPAPEAAPASDATPVPGSAPAADAAPGSAGRRGLAAALVLGALGAGLVLFAAGETWATGSAPVGGAHVPVAVSGKTVTGLPDALALVGLAALVAVFAVRRVGRTVVAVLLTLCGVGTVWTAAAGASGVSALNAAAARTSGLTATTAEHAAHTGWPWLAVFGGLLQLGAGLLAVVRGASWPAMGSRYERDGSPRPRPAARRAPDPEAPGEIWKALDRGEDPTAGG